MSSREAPSEAAAPGPPELRERLAALGARLGAREAGEAEALAEAWRQLEALHERVSQGLAAFHAAATGAGAPQLRVEVSPPRVDDKHLRSVQFDLRRGRHRAIVTARSRGDLALVGPFREGKVEGPCASFPFSAAGEIHAALADFLERFLEAAAAP